MPKTRLPRIYLDLDGVMADFDAFFPDTFGIHHKSMADEEMWEKITSHGSFFLDMPVCPGALEFFDSVRQYDPIILTACPKTNYKNVAIQKKKWVARHLDPNLMVLPVMGGSNKFLFMHQPKDILIDDFERNCKAWGEAGGHCIHHQWINGIPNWMKTKLHLCTLHPEYDC